MLMRWGIGRRPWRGLHEDEGPVRDVHPEITQIYSRRSRAVAINDSHVPSAPSAAPKTKPSTSLPISGDIISPSLSNDLDIPIALRKESRTCKSNYRAPTSYP